MKSRKLILASLILTGTIAATSAFASSDDGQPDNAWLMQAPVEQLHSAPLPASASAPTPASAGTTVTLADTASTVRDDHNQIVIP